VCSALDTVKQQRVAIKKVLTPFHSLLFAKRLLREIKILSCLQHENVIRLVDLQKPLHKQGWNEVYMVTELMDTDLAQILKSKQELSDQHVQFFIYQLLKGLKYIHSANVMHRDLVR